MTRCDWLLLLDAPDDLIACCRRPGGRRGPLALCQAADRGCQRSPSHNWRPREAIVGDLLDVRS